MFEFFILALDSLLLNPYYATRKAEPMHFMVIRAILAIQTSPPTQISMHESPSFDFLSSYMP